MTICCSSLHNFKYFKYIWMGSWSVKQSVSNLKMPIWEPKVWHGQEGRGRKLKTLTPCLLLLYCCWADWWRHNHKKKVQVDAVTKVISQHFYGKSDHTVGVKGRVIERSSQSWPHVWLYYETLVAQTDGEYWTEEAEMVNRICKRL